MLAHREVCGACEYQAVLEARRQKERAKNRRQRQWKSLASRLIDSARAQLFYSRLSVKNNGATPDKGS
jgi:sRNA-binding protein